MGTISKEILSGSTLGAPISIGETGSPGDIIHTTGISSTVIDEVWIYATNVALVQRDLTIEHGGTGSADYEIKLGIPPRSGLSIVLPGLVLSGDGFTGSSIRAYSDSPGSINIVGYVNRITP
jgi:hypothetical protein